MNLLIVKNHRKNSRDIMNFLEARKVCRMIQNLNNAYVERESITSSLNKNAT